METRRELLRKIERMKARLPKEEHGGDLTDVSSFDTMEEINAAYAYLHCEISYRKMKAKVNYQRSNIGLMEDNDSIEEIRIIYERKMGKRKEKIKLLVEIEEMKEKLPPRTYSVPDVNSDSKLEEILFVHGTLSLRLKKYMFFLAAFTMLATTAAEVAMMQDV